MRGGLILAIVSGLTLAGCDLIQAPAGSETGGGETPAPTRTSAFSHSQSDDISGYYRATGASVGDLTLHQVYVGRVADFEAWEAGHRSPGFAPVILEFTRGGETLRVLPERYSVSDGRLTFRGQSTEVGQVSFEARLDKEALATARRNLGGAEEAAITATAQVDGQTLSGIKLHWYGGD